MVKEKRQADIDSKENPKVTEEQDLESDPFLDTAVGILLTDQEKQDPNYLYSRLLLVSEEIIRSTLQRTEAQLTTRIRILSQRQSYLLKLMEPFISQPTEEEQKQQENITKSSKDSEDTSTTSNQKN
jgi:hypothetical protein